MLSAALTAVVFWCATAAPPEPDPATVERSLAHHEAAKALFEKGSFEQAAREWAAAYSILPKPNYLLNLGQAYRRLGDLRRARQAFVDYLAQAPADSSAFESTQATVRALDAELAAQPKPPVKRPPARAVASPPPAPTAPPPEPPPEPAPAVVRSADAPREVALTPHVPSVAPAVTVVPPNPAVHLGWAIPVGVVVVAGAVVSIWAATRPPAEACVGAGSLGCLDLRSR